MNGENGIDAAAALLSDAAAVLLDFNGTLSLDEDLLESCYAGALAACDLPPLRPAEYAGLLGQSEEDIASALTAARGGMVPRRVLLDEVTRAYVSACRVHPRIPEKHLQVLRALQGRGIPLAIVTGTLRKMIQPVLDDLDLVGIIPVVITVEDVAHGKPDPEGFRLAVDRLRVAGPRLVVLEDSPAGIAAGHAAGASVIGCGDAAIGADAWVSDLGQLAGKL